MSIKKLLFSRAKAVPTERLTSHITSHTTNWQTCRQTTWTTSTTTNMWTYYNTGHYTRVGNSTRTTSTTTSWNTQKSTFVRNVYRLTSVAGTDWLNGGVPWRAGDVGIVYGPPNASGYGARTITIQTVNAQGIPQSYFTSNEGGYTSNSPGDGTIQGPRGTRAVWWGGQYATMPEYRNTTVLTSRVTSWNTSVPVDRYTSYQTSRVTTVAVTSHLTSITTCWNVSRVTSYPTHYLTDINSTPVPDPDPDPIPSGEAYILVIGQSNIANYGAWQYNYTPTQDVLQLNQAGNAWVSVPSPAAANSLSTGDAGNYLGRMGDLLIGTGDYTKVRIVNVAVGGTKIGWWGNDIASPTARYPVRDDDSFPYPSMVRAMGHRDGVFGNWYWANLFDKIAFAQARANAMGFSFTHILLHIGESDAIANTSIAAYTTGFNNLKNRMRSIGITAPIFQGRASYAWGDINTNIITAQNNIITNNSDVYSGPNSDNLGSTYRHDDLHFNEAGLQTLAQQWVNFITTRWSSPI